MHQEGQKSSANISPVSCQQTAIQILDSFPLESPHLVLRILHSILPDKFQLHKLQQFVGVRDAVESRSQVLQGLLVADRHESGERIALTGTVGFGLEEGLDKLRRVRDERFRVLVDRCDGPDGILSHVRMAVFQTRACGGEERLDEFRFSEFAQESQGIASDVFIGMLQVVTDAIAVQTGMVILDSSDGTRGIILTTPGSFPASTCHSCRAWGRFRSRSIAASSKICSSRA